ncbi:MAG: DNA repair exonuclease [Candidatus Kaelpia aquatica]|nr:DNA repair exonuclease [Candidatus Kaelpia aquatica]
MQANFIQISDFHLDSKFLGFQDLDKISQRKKELEETFKKVIQFTNSIKEELDFILFAGDLFEGDYFSPHTIKSLIIYGIESLKPLPVYIVAGNHDILEDSSPYLIYDWPENAHIFGSDFEKIKIKDDLYLWGVSVSPENVSKNLLKDLSVEDREALNIVLMHGAETGTAEESIFGDSLPFSSGDIDSSGADYIALGHYHNCRPVPRSSERVLGYYSGSPESLSFKELGERFVLKVGLKKGEVPRIDKISFQRRYYKEIEVDCSGVLSLDEAKDMIKDNGDKDAVVSIVLKGDIDPDIRIDLEDIDDYIKQSGLFFAFNLKNNIRSAYSKELIESSLLGKNFIKILQDRKTSKEVVDIVTKIGLDAIFTKEIRGWNEV